MHHLVVTRPEPDTGLWVQQLQTQGIKASALPLMEIAPSRSPLALASLNAALQQLGSYSAIMFVSGNAVRYFFEQLRAQARALPAQAQLWTPGPGTTKALLAESISPLRLVQPAPDAPQFDSESLWEQARHHVCAGQKVLIVRGGDGQEAIGQGRQWLTEQLQACGVQVDFASVYERRAPTPTAERLQAIQALRDQHVAWLFSSSECVQHLVLCNTAWSWQAHTALATHPRIAQQARLAGFGRIIETMPTVQSIVASIKSLHDLP